VAQLGRAPASGAGGRGFESRQPDSSPGAAGENSFLFWKELPEQLVLDHLPSLRQVSAMPVELKVGNLAPEFRGQAIGGKYGDGQAVSLADFRGSAVVLYFYPKDDTPGCTVQACGLRDAWGELSAHANIFGVSVDSAASHEKFIKKHQLPFPLLSDADKKIVDSYGVWVEKSMYGKKYMGAERSTFIIDGAGRISSIFRKVKPEEHVTILREALRNAVG
jgi:thioredoxin-dependent peroxiredoxin